MPCLNPRSLRRVCFSTPRMNGVLKHALHRSTFRRRRRWCSATRRLRLAAAVPAENPRGGKLAQLVTDHVFLDEDGDELVAVVHLELVPDKLGNDRARASPGSNG